MQKPDLSTLNSVVIGAIGLWLGVQTFSRDTNLSIADYAERIKETEIRSLSNTDEIDKSAAELKGIAGELATLSRAMDAGAMNEQIAQIIARLDAVESRPAATATGGVTADEVAAVLARDYANRLRGPAGPKGDAGPTGPAGTASSGAIDPGAPIVIDATFSTQYDEMPWDQAKVMLLGCSGGGGSVTCDFVLTGTGSANFRHYVYASHSRIALPSGEWVQGTRVTANGNTSNRAELNMVPDIPVRVSVDYEGGSGAAEGLLALELGNSKVHPIWKNVALVD